MLQELRIKNLAIIDEMDLTFSKGLNILTGETGAGKTIILNAVQLLLGDRGSEDLIRTSEDEASVEALFDLSENRLLKEKIREIYARTRDGENEDTLLIRRVLSRRGRGKVFVNGMLATLGMLSEVGDELLSIYGQHEHQTLQRAETHIDILDEFGRFIGLRENFQEQYRRLAWITEEVQRIREEKERRSKERDLMTFQVKEIEASRLRPGEEEALKEERGLLVHAERLMGFANSSEQALYGDEGSAISRLQGVLRQGREMVTIDPSLSDVLKSLESTLIQLEEVSLSLREYARRVEVDPLRLEELEGRLDEIDRLKRKYGLTIEDILRFKKTVEETLRSFGVDEEKLSLFERDREPLRQKVMELAEKLSVERRKAGSELKKSVEKELASLGMRKTTFDARVEPSSLSLKGTDHVEFLISPNLGETVKPLAKIASGGELSRIMLAMKRILAKVGARQLLIFDEVDSGIGGAIAEVVGRKMKDLSKHHQVVCVTHLPQIAAFADTHYSVRKEVRGGRTVTVVNHLGKEATVEEIARMLGGVKVTEKTLAHAKEMLDNAKKS